MAFTVVSTIFISSFAFYTIIIRPFRPVSSKVKNLDVVLLLSCDITRFDIVESAIFRYYFSFYTTIRRFCPESNIISFISSQYFTFFCLSFCLGFFIFYFSLYTTIRHFVLHPIQHKRIEISYVLLLLAMIEPCFAHCWYVAASWKHYVGALLISTDQPTSSWWLQMP